MAGKIKVVRTIKAGHPHIKKIETQNEFSGRLVAVRYYKNTDTGGTWKTFEVRPHNKSLNGTAKAPPVSSTLDQ